MGRSLCIIHANCQGDSLHRILASTPAFSRCFSIHKYTNYLEERISSADFAACGLLLYQPLSDKWHEAASSALVARLPLGAQALQIPNMFFKGYWPLWTNKTFMAYGDVFMEYLAAQTFTPMEILHVCTHADLPRMYPIDEWLQQSINRERDKEVNSVVETVDLVQEFWRSEKLFTTVNHPGSRLLLHVADGVLQALGLGRVPESVRAAFAAQCHDDFEQPVYPQIGAHFGLTFANASTKYAVFGRHMSFAEYCQCYLACRREEISDFAAFMHYFSTQCKTRAA
ncbi:MAG: WcbI family polysaccharide biosynthesis putative acetyltransferase [Desulfovibrionaceae bacterium]